MRTRNWKGEVYGISPCHKSCKMLENACTRFPLVPNGFTMLTALFHLPSGGTKTGAL
jgi:hypothetical protein